jgi:tRNA threonylcarbamoyladenosine biosynthesis protein TsaB
MAHILSIDTSTPVCSVAIHHQGTLLGNFSLHLDKGHSSALHVLIDDLLKHCQLAPHQLGAIAVGKGPGSYTGLRIGSSTAKGLCFSLNIPLIAVNTLQAMALSVANSHISDSLLCPMIDARRMEVYCMILDSQATPLTPTWPEVVNEFSFDQYLSHEKVIFFGNGSAKCKSVVSKNPNATFLNGVVPDASQIGAIAWEKFQSREFEDIAYFEPFYLKEFQISKPKTNL